MTPINHKRITISLLVVVGLIVFLFASKKPAAPLGAATQFNGAQTKSVMGQRTNTGQMRKSAQLSKQRKWVKLQNAQYTSAGYKNRGKIIEYLSSQQAGIIGLYDGKQVDNPADNIFTVRMDNRPGQDDRVWLTYKLTGVDDYTNIACSVNDRLAIGGYLVKKNNETHRQRVQVDPTWLQQGINRIQFGLPEQADYGYKVEDLVIEVEKGTNDSPLAVNAGQTLYNGKAYIHGFVQKGLGIPSKIEVDGKSIALRDGEFETILTPSAQNKVKVSAEINGKQYIREIAYSENKATQEVYVFNEKGQKIAKSFAKGKPDSLFTATASLKVSEKSLLIDKTLSATSLREQDLPALDMGMYNVTDKNKGVRFLPHGEHFSQPATVTLKYDRTKIPDGYTENDIRTYYFDNQTHHWVALERDTVDKVTCMVISKTTHFTDMINGVIKTPESPETQGFTPTQMNDIKAADPTSKIGLIAPPTANNQGSANLSYSLEMPPARNGMSPNLAISYNSDGGSGWLGEGWDLHVPSITVDTKFGVPTYNCAFETEAYSLGGVMLARAFIKDRDTLDEKMFFPDRGVVYLRNKNTSAVKNDVYQFYTRIAGDFQLIERIGTETYDYKWRVTDKRGTKYYYGYNGAVLAKDTLINGLKVNRHIAEWKLQSVADIHGDSVAYSYNITDEEGYGVLKPKAIYLEKVEGFTFQQASNSYIRNLEVDFVSNSWKKKKINHARYGFLVSNQKLLDLVIVKTLNEQGQWGILRSYKFKYSDHEFNTSLLDSVKQFDSDGKEVGSHGFSYYNDVVSNNSKSYVNANPAYIYNSNSNSIGFSKYLTQFLVQDKLGMLDNSRSIGKGGALYIGLGAGIKVWNSDNTIGVNTSYQNIKTDGKSTLIDINGDGLPEKVYELGGKLFYRPILLNGTLGNEVLLEGAPGAFSQTMNENLSLGLMAKGSVFGISLNGRIDKDLLNKTTTKTYFSDVNGDGLVDIVSKEKVYFNYLDKQGIPHFSQNSKLSAIPMTNKTIYDLTPAAAGLIRYDTAPEDTVKSQSSPLQDVVRVWQAPYSGVVNITGDIKLLPPPTNYDTLTYKKADGIRVAIQRGYTEGWSKVINKDDFSVTPVNQTMYINIGDKIYFRAQSGDKLLSNGDFDRILWSPTITYLNGSESIDENGYSSKVFKASEGNIVSKTGYNQIDTIAPVTIKGSFSKPVTTADVKLEIFSSNYPTEYPDTVDVNGNYVCNEGYEFKTIATNVYLKEQSYNCNLNLPIQDNKHTYFWFRLSSTKDVRWEQIKCYPEIHYTYNKNNNVISDTVLAGVKYDIKKEYVARANTNNDASTIDLEYAKIRPFMMKNGMSITPDICNPVKGQIEVSSSNYSTKYDFTLTSSNKDNYILYYTGTKRPYSTFVLYLDEDTYKNNSFGIEVINYMTNEKKYIKPLLVKVRPKGSDLGPLWRGWGQFVYNAAEGRYAKPIEIDSLALPNDSDDLVFDKTRLIPFAPHFKTKKYWQGYSDNIWIKGDTLCAGRLMNNDLADFDEYMNPLSGLRSATVDDNSSDNVDTRYYITAPNLVSKQTNFSIGVGASLNVLQSKLPAKVRKKIKIDNIGINASQSQGTSQKILDYIDMNGDGYPDYFKEGKITYSNSRGTVTDIAYQKQTPQNETSASNLSIELGKSYKTTMTMPKLSSTTDTKTKSIEVAGTINASAGVGKSWNKLQISYLDINGDGLPDLVNNETGKIAINYGYSFSEDIPFESLESSTVSTFSFNGGLGIGVEKNKGSFVAGIGMGCAISTSNQKFLDINGDGLVDIVNRVNDDLATTSILNFYIPQKKLSVRFNNGNSFDAPVDWCYDVKMENTVATTQSANATGTVGIPILFAWLKIVFSLSVNVSDTYTRLLDDIRDLNGDGYPDIVSSELLNDRMKVCYSTINRTNKLKSVTNPFGGNFILDYIRSSATSDHPGGKWVMKSVAVKDEITDDGPDMLNQFAYYGGKYNRREREFSGFAEVITSNINTENGQNVISRKTTQNYDVSSYYTKGNLLKTTVKDGNGKTYHVAENIYYSYDVKTRREQVSVNGLNQQVDGYRCYDMGANAPSDSIVVYAPLKYTKNTVCEDGGNGLVTNQSFYNYWISGKDAFGDLRTYRYSDKGTLKSDGSGEFNYQTDLAYKHGMTTKYYVAGIPVDVTVKDYNQNILRHMRAYYNQEGHPTHLTRMVQFTSDKDSVTTTLTYDKAGNILKKELPSKMTYNYTYDDRYQMYVTQVTDTFGYTSKLEDYDYRFGIPRKTTDINGNMMTTTLDNLGRVTSIKGPNDPVYTLKFEYHPQATFDANGITAPAYAVTKHYDQTHPGDDLETVTFVDGLGRPVQVKKEGYVDGQPTMIVSGRAKYDAFGRVTQAYYPVTEPMSNKLNFNRTFDNLAPTNTTYDVLDRVLSVTLPDGNMTSTSYSIANGLLKTTVTDAENHSQTSFANGSGQTVRTEQYHNGETIATTFEYDPINQLHVVTDAKGGKTVSEYDMAGRRTQVTHPASGTTLFKYDQSGNLTAKQSANLAKTGKWINYLYTFSRLDSISYPDHPENNVRYVYGSKDESGETNGYRAGRLKRQTDGSGAQEFRYGKMGEITEVKRTLVIPNQAVATYTTNWTYDSWNRVLSMTYPDGEVLNYNYNTGGLLNGLSGTKGSETYTYVSNIGYDKFEQRASMQYGNGAVTTYTYDPLNRRLGNLKVHAGNADIMNNTYTYDNVSNVKSVTNTGSPANGLGGAMVHNYQYDDLYRLKSADGTFTGANGKTANYTLAMGYDNLHNITRKSQHISQSNVQFNGLLQAGYDLGYSYAYNPQQISNIADTSYRTESAIVKTAKLQNYSYDANGNLLCVITGTKNTDGKLIRNNERKLLWDEENRLLALSDNGFVSNYWYDAAGERTVKTFGDAQGVSVNGLTSAATTGTTNFTAYISPYMVVNNGGNYTKHIYIGSQRITSKVSDSGIFGTSPVTTSALQAKYAMLTAKIKTRYDSLGVTYQGIAQAGGLVSKTPSTASSPYFYHSDHLGSSSLITDGSAAVVQHLEYVPFGETFIDERRSASSWTTPYLFSAKERDEETGLTYFGARYYDSRTSVWLSSDDLREQYPNISSYVYCLDNPVKLVDPDGNSPRGVSYSTSILGWFIPPAKAQTPGQMMQKDGFHRKLGHVVLDGAGMVPLAGEVFDGLNGFIYGIEGNKIDAAFSLGACIPIVGWVSTGAKWTGMTFRAAWKVDARIVNKSFEKLLQKAPYDEAFNVFEGVTKNNEKFVRVHGEHNKFSKWMMRESDIEGLSPQQIKDKFALPELPSQISDVNVPAGTKIRVGVAKGIDGWGKGGGTQVELLNNIPSESFTNTRKL